MSKLNRMDSKTDDRRSLEEFLRKYVISFVQVYRWVPEDLHPFVDITIGDALPINCTVESSAKEMVL